MSARWSGLKADIRRLLAPSVAKRFDVHVTYYRHWKEEDGRVWVTWDGAEIYSFDDARFWQRVNPFHEDLKSVGQDVDESWDRAIHTARIEGTSMSRASMNQRTGTWACRHEMPSLRMILWSVGCACSTGGSASVRFV